MSRISRRPLLAHSATTAVGAMIGGAQSFTFYGTPAPAPLN
ncbi:hypothetical protein ACRAWF_43445 [Streptomyces sp. L7]